MFDSANGNKDERRERWLRRKGWGTFHFVLDNIPPDQNIGPVSESLQRAHSGQREPVVIGCDSCTGR